MRTLTKLDGDSSRARRELHDHIQGSGPLARHTVDSHGQRQAGASSFHESAEKHVTGKATYIDDIKTPQDALYVALGLSPVAHGTLTKLELDAVRQAPGVVDVIGAIFVLKYLNRLQYTPLSFVTMQGVSNCLRFAHPAEATGGLEAWMIGGEE